jgi:hypothetical protein
MKRELTINEGSMRRRRLKKLIVKEDSGSLQGSN